jgi:adenylylsulfate reductase subunit A
MEVLNTDLIIVGGGTAGCIAAYEASRKDLDVVIVEKSSIERSGCLAPGVNAIYSYLHDGEKPEEFVRWIRFQGMGILREDLALSMIKETPQAVSILEDYGLYIEKENGKYAKQGRWGLRIRGEKIKPILAAMAKENSTILEKTVAVDLVKSSGSGWGVLAFSVESGQLYGIKSKSVLVATGGASGIYRPYTIPWYPPSNSGSGYAMGIRAGAEMTSFEMRFAPIRIKDINAPIGVTAVGFNAPMINSLNEEFMKVRYREMGGESAPIPIRVYAPMKEIMEGRFPCYIDTRGLTENQIDQLKKLYLNGWPIFVLFLVARQINPAKEPLEIQGAEPYITGSHAMPGFWINTERQTSLKGLFAAGDASGGVPLSHVGGALAEGLISARSIRDYVIKNDRANISDDVIEKAMDDVMQPLDIEGVSPFLVESRLQRVMDEYAGGLSRFYQYNEKSLLTALKEIQRMKEFTMAAQDLFELQVLYEVRDKLDVAELTVHHMMFRKETRWPGFQSRTDFPDRKEGWEVFVNSRKRESIKIFTRPYVRMVE